MSIVREQQGPPPFGPPSADAGATPPGRNEGPRGAEPCRDEAVGPRRGPASTRPRPVPPFEPKDLPRVPAGSQCGSDRLYFVILLNIVSLARSRKHPTPHDPRPSEASGGLPRLQRRSPSAIGPLRWGSEPPGPRPGFPTHRVRVGSYHLYLYMAMSGLTLKRS